MGRHSISQVSMSKWYPKWRISLVWTANSSSAISSRNTISRMGQGKVRLGSAGECDAW